MVVFCPRYRGYVLAFCDKRCGIRRGCIFGRDSVSPSDKELARGAVMFTTSRTNDDDDDDDMEIYM